MEFDDGTNIKKSYGIYGVYGHELLITTENKHLSPKIGFEDMFVLDVVADEQLCFWGLQLPATVGVIAVADCRSN